MRSFMWIAALAAAFYCTPSLAQVPDLPADIPNQPAADVEGQFSGEVQAGDQVRGQFNGRVDGQIDADVDQLPNANTAGQAEVEANVQSGASDSDRNRGDNQWRYRRHNGRWWYWTPNNSWVYWNNNQWNPYVAGQSFRNNPARQYNYYRGPGNAYDNRYDGYYDGYNRSYRGYDNRYYDGYNNRYNNGYYGPGRGNYQRYNNQPGVQVGPGGVRLNF